MYLSKYENDVQIRQIWSFFTCVTMTRMGNHIFFKSKRELMIFEFIYSIQTQFLMIYYKPFYQKFPAKVKQGCFIDMSQ